MRWLGPPSGTLTPSLICIASASSVTLPRTAYVRASGSTRTDGTARRSSAADKATARSSAGCASPGTSVCPVRIPRRPCRSPIPAHLNLRSLSRVRFPLLLGVDSGGIMDLLVFNNHLDDRRRRMYPTTGCDMTRAYRYCKHNV